MIHFLRLKLKKVIVSENFFKFNNRIISLLPVLQLQINWMVVYRQHIFQEFKYQYLNYKQIWWRYTSNAFFGL